ncbi:hypothetical protein QQF64_034870 [Cirrhinus molitorella]|uniref:Uncharacterized protein n=1 Tax=Cirrhinus molitorella TaxID=172907 RepID=A0ABR3NER7_9TELE
MRLCEIPSGFPRLDAVPLCVELLRLSFALRRKTTTSCCVTSDLLSDAFAAQKCQCKPSTQSHNPPVRLWMDELAVIISVQWRYRSINGLRKVKAPSDPSVTKAESRLN